MRFPLRCTRPLPLTFLHSSSPGTLRLTCKSFRRVNTNTFATASKSGSGSLQSSDRPKWSHLSLKGKVKRTTTDTGNLSIILIGVGVFVVIAYVVTSELLLPDSTTRVFSHAVDRIRESEACKQALGEPIKGYGEPSSSRMARVRPIASQIVHDSQQRQHLVMRFNVQGPHAKGTAYVDMVRPDDQHTWDYSYLIVDIPTSDLAGMNRIKVIYNDKGIAGSGIKLYKNV